MDSHFWTHQFVECHLNAIYVCVCACVFIVMICVVDVNFNSLPNPLTTGIALSIFRNMHKHEAMNRDNGWWVWREATYLWLCSDRTTASSWAYTSPLFFFFLLFSYLTDLRAWHMPRHDRGRWNAERDIRRTEEKSYHRFINLFRTYFSQPNSDKIIVSIEVWTTAFPIV